MPIACTNSSILARIGESCPSILSPSFFLLVGGAASILVKYILSEIEPHAHMQESHSAIFGLFHYFVVRERYI